MVYTEQLNLYLFMILCLFIINFFNLKLILWNLFNVILELKQAK